MSVFRRLRLSLTAVCAAGTGLVLVAMAVAAFQFSAGLLRAQAEESFQSSLGAVFYYMRSQPVISHTWMAQTEAESGVWLSAESATSQLIYTAMDPVREELTTLAKETARDRYGFDYLAAPSSRFQPDTITFLLNTVHGQYRVAVARVPTGDAWLCVTLLRPSEQAQIHQLALVFAGCVILALACLVIFAWRFTARAVRPVEQGRQRQTEFVSAASHELRAPLTVMQVTAEGIKDSPPDMHDRFADIILRECTRLSRLAGDLLGLAGADSLGWSVTLAPESPETILLRAAENFEQTAAGRGIAIRSELPSPPLQKLPCDSQRIEQVLAVLLDNALRYTPDGGDILLRVFRQRRFICFTVADSGPGVPADQREAVFERFYRGDKSRTDREHYGLGLSIARDIAAAHRGDLSVGDGPLGGAEFVLRVPIRRGGA